MPSLTTVEGANRRPSGAKVVAHPAVGRTRGAGLEGLRPRRTARRAGFTMAEVLLAATIPAFGLLGMIGVLSASSTDLAKSGGTLRMLGLTRQRFE